MPVSVLSLSVNVVVAVRVAVAVPALPHNMLSSWLVTNNDDARYAATAGRLTHTTARESCVTEQPSQGRGCPHTHSNCTRLGGKPVYASSSPESTILMVEAGRPLELPMDSICLTTSMPSTISPNTT